MNQSEKDDSKTVTNEIDRLYFLIFESESVDDAQRINAVRQLVDWAQSITARLNVMTDQAGFYGAGFTDEEKNQGYEKAFQAVQAVAQEQISWPVENSPFSAKYLWEINKWRLAQLGVGDKINYKKPAPGHKEPWSLKTPVDYWILHYYGIFKMIKAKFDCEKRRFEKAKWRVIDKNISANDAKSKTVKNAGGSKAEEPVTIDAKNPHFKDAITPDGKLNWKKYVNNFPALMQPCADVPELTEKTKGIYFTLIWEMIMVLHFGKPENDPNLSRLGEVNRFKGLIGVTHLHKNVKMRKESENVRNEIREKLKEAFYRIVIN